MNISCFCVSVDDVQLSCYRIVMCFYSLGTGKNPFVERYEHKHSLNSATGRQMDFNSTHEQLCVFESLVKMNRSCHFRSL